MPFKISRCNINFVAAFFSLQIYLPFYTLPFPKYPLMKHILSILMVSFVLFFIACGNTENNKLIVGNWQGVQWLVAGQPSENMANQTFFSFDSTGAYTYQYDNNKENGTYKVANDELYTTPQNEMEIMVKIKKLTQDSLIFEMNRGGKAEELTLLRR